MFRDYKIRSICVHTLIHCVGISWKARPSGARPNYSHTASVGDQFNFKSIVEKPFDYFGKNA